MEKLQAACGGAAESKDGGRLRDAKKRTSGGKKKKKKLRQRQFAVRRVGGVEGTFGISPRLQQH